MNHDELARLLPVPDGRDLPADRKQILKEHLMTELRQAGRNQAGRNQAGRNQAGRNQNGKSRPRRPGRIAAAGLATAAITATAVAVAIAMATAGTSPLGTPGPASPGPPGGTPHTAAQLLAKVAYAAAGQPAPVVKDSEFTYIRSIDAYSVGTDDSKPSIMEKPHERQIWQSVSNICADGLLIENGKRTVLSDAPTAVKVIPPLPKSQQLTCPSEGHPGDATYRLLQSIPTEPKALLAYLEAAKKFTNDDPPTEIGDLIRESIVPPDLAAALYRLAATLPGATLIPHATTGTGLPGIGIMWTGQEAKQVYKNEWIFDPKTLQFVGEKTFDPGTGKLNGESTVVRRAFVARAGQVPS